MELHIAAAMKRPVEAFLMVARSQHVPTMRFRANTVRKKKPLFPICGAHGGWRGKLIGRGMEVYDEFEEANAVAVVSRLRYIGVLIAGPGRS